MNTLTFNDPLSNSEPVLHNLLTYVEEMQIEERVTNGTISFVIDPINSLPLYCVSDYIATSHEKLKDDWDLSLMHQPDYVRLFQTVGGKNYTSMKGLLYLNSKLNRLFQIPFNAKQRKHKNTKGEIYILRSKKEKTLKVGFSTNVGKRLKTHQGSNPGLELLDKYLVENIEVEKGLHKHLSKYRIKGTKEWYTDTEETQKQISVFLMEYRQ